MLAGGGVRYDNVRKLIEATGVSEVHSTARVSVPSQMRFRPVSGVRACVVFDVHTAGLLNALFNWLIFHSRNIAVILQSCIANIVIGSFEVLMFGAFTT